MQRYIRVALGAACACWLFCTQASEPVGVDAGGQGAALKPAGFTTQFQRATGRVLCTWQEPSVPVSFYRLYRAAVGSGEYMYSTGDRSRILAPATSYEDIVGLENADYVYAVCAVVILQIDSSVGTDSTYYDTAYTQGPPSNTSVCHVGSGLAFSINSGDLYTANDTCQLTVLDFYDSVLWVAFSPDSVFLPDSVDTLKMQHNDATHKDTLRGWVLRQGPGTKYVWARLQRGHYVTDIGTGDTIDTVFAGDTLLKDDIGIRPYRIGVKLRNETRPPDPTMRVWYKRDKQGDLVTGKGLTDRYTIYRPRVEFSFSIFSDTTFASQFEYGLLFPVSGWTADADWSWLGRLITDSLTGIGAGHDDLHRYVYAFGPDPADPDAAANLSRLIKLPAKNNDSLYGYFTGNPASVARADTVDTFTQRGAYEALRYLSGTEELAAGRKEFSVVLVMRGRYFNELRLVCSSARLDPSQNQTNSYDSYAPSIHRDFWEFYYPPDGSTIDQAIDISLNNAGTIFDADSAQLLERGLVWDKGGAPVSDIEFVVAAMPDSIVNKWYSDSLWNKLSYDYLKTLRQHVYTFPRTAQDTASKVFPVYWDNIDPSLWDTGWYLVYFVAGDRYGNKGVSTFYAGWGTDYANTHNPQHWKFVTGSVGL